MAMKPDVFDDIHYNQLQGTLDYIDEDHNVETIPLETFLTEKGIRLIDILKAMGYVPMDHHKAVMLDISPQGNIVTRTIEGQKRVL